MAKTKHAQAAVAASTPGSEGLSRDARARLLEAALRLFGRSGLDGVSTRQLAKAAGVNLATIPYHFGGKQGLYIAVAAHLVEQRAAPARQLVDALRHSLRSTAVGPQQAAAMLRELIATLGRTILLAPQAASMVGYLSREQLHPTQAFDVVYEGLIRPVHETLALLVARMAGRTTADRRMVMRAHAIVGQILAFHFARAAALRRLGWDAYTPSRVEELIAEISDFVFHGLAVAETGAGTRPARKRAKPAPRRPR